MRTLLMLLLASTLACAAEPTTGTTTRPVPAPATTRPAVPVAGIWTETGMPIPGRRDDEPRKLIVGVWSDGTIVWSTAGAGKPYRTARLEPAAVDKLVKDLDAIHFFDDAEVNHHRTRYPPDAGHTVMAAESGDKRQRLALWRDPPKDRFGEVWTQARQRIEALKPADGKPLEAEIDPRVFQLARELY